MFPSVIDNTMRKNFTRCAMFYKRRHIDNLQPEESDNLDTHFGGCVAKGLEAARLAFYFGGKTPTEAFSAAVEAAEKAWGSFVVPPPKNPLWPSYKSKSALAPLFDYYFDKWPLDADDALVPVVGGVERRFAIELPIRHPETNDLLHYAGRFDMLTYDAKTERHVIVDEKTASKFSDAWMAQWDIDSQMTGYIWAMRQELARRNELKNIMAQIRAVAVKKSTFEHIQLPIIRTGYAITQWYEQLIRDVKSMVVQYNHGEWNYALSDACTAYGRACDYMPLCKSSSPEQHIAGNYKIVVWNPLGD